MVGLIILISWVVILFELKAYCTQHPDYWGSRECIELCVLSFLLAPLALVYLLVKLYRGRGNVGALESATGNTGNKAEDAGRIVDSLNSQLPTQETRTVTKPRRSSLGGAILLTICTALPVLSGTLYVIRSSDPLARGGVEYAITSCIIPFACWYVYFRRHYFTKTPVSMDGWSTTLLIVGILFAIAASRNLVVKSPAQIVHEINANAPRDTENDQNAKMRKTLTDLMELNKEAHAIDVEFENSYGGKNFLQAGCFLSPDVVGVCLADTQKALDSNERVIERMNTLKKSRYENPLQVAQYQTMVKMFTATINLYRYAAEPSRQVGVDSRDGRIHIVGVDAFNLKLNTALTDQSSFRKATKAYVENRSKVLGDAGLKPEDLESDTAQSK